MPSLLSLPVLRSADLAVRLVPPVVAAPAARVGGRLYRRLAPDERTVVEANLRRVRPELTGAALDRAVGEVFAGYGRYWADSLRLPHLDRGALERGFTVEGLEIVTGALEEGRSPIVALPHLGTWEWAAAWMTQIAGFDLTAVAERLEPPEVYDWFLDYRRGLGMDIIPLGPDAGTQLAAAMRAPRIVTLLCDRDITGDGIEVEFFGETTKLPGGPAPSPCAAARRCCPRRSTSTAPEPTEWSTPHSTPNAAAGCEPTSPASPRTWRTHSRS